VSTSVSSAAVVPVNCSACSAPAAIACERRWLITAFSSSSLLG
jgi:hypothetical protein